MDLLLVLCLSEQRTRGQFCFGIPFAATPGAQEGRMNKQEWLVLGGFGAAASYLAYRAVKTPEIAWISGTKQSSSPAALAGLGLVIARRYLVKALASPYATAIPLKWSALRKN